MRKRATHQPPKNRLKGIIWIVTRIGIPLALVWLFIWWRINAGVDAAFASVSPFMQTSHGSSNFSLNGDVIINRVLLGSPPQSGESVEVRAERVTVHTPGLVWLLRSGIFGPEREFPERLGFTLTNVGVTGVAIDPKNIQWSGIYSGALFEAAGCSARQWDREDLRTLGLTPAPSTIKVESRRTGSDTVDLMVAIGTPNAGMFEGRLTMTAVGVDKNPAALPVGTMIAGDLTFRDEGFITARNEYCAKEAGITAAQFVDRHMEAVRAQLRKIGLQADPALEAAYRTYATGGGVLTVQARPQSGLMFSEFARLRGDNLRQMLSPIVTVNDGDPVLLALGPVTQAPASAVATATDPATGAPVDATVAATATPVAPDAPATQEAAPLVAYAGANTGGGDFAVESGAYADLRDAVGKQVLVKTTNGTTRRGELLRFTNSSLELKLGPREGGIQLSIPRDAVREVGSVVAADESAPAEGGKNAKAK